MFTSGVRYARSAESEGTSPSWQQALPGWEYVFPADHAIHPDYKTEWWYFTGNVKTEEGDEYGYELTFFRQGMLAPALRSSLENQAEKPGRFAQSDFKFAHFAVSDLKHRKFYYVEKINRGAFGEAGFAGTDSNSRNGSTKPLAWIEDWSLVSQPDGAWKITAKAAGETPMSIDLLVKSAKPPIIHGAEGISQKSDGAGNASHYYSFTRLATAGTLTLGAASRTRHVRGDSWFDHEWASNQLGADQVGWDWFCCQFSDGTELMLYAMRKRDGSIDSVSSGTWVDADGHSRHLAKQDFGLRALRTWKSERTRAVYPVAWRMSIPSLQLDFDLNARLDAQELALPLISYWEGAVSMSGKRAGQSVHGVGYMELTGYAGPLTGLQKSDGQANVGQLRQPVR